MMYFVNFLFVAFGFTLCWFAKDEIVIAFTSTKAFATKLEAKAKALKAAL